MRPKLEIQLVGSTHMYPNFQTAIATTLQRKGTTQIDPRFRKSVQGPDQTSLGDRSLLPTRGCFQSENQHSEWIGQQRKASRPDVTGFLKSVQQQPDVTFIHTASRSSRHMGYNYGLGGLIFTDPPAADIVTTRPVLART